MTNEFKPGDVVQHRKTGRLAVVRNSSEGYSSVSCYTTGWGIMRYERKNLEPTGATFDLQKALEDAVWQVKGKNP